MKKHVVVVGAGVVGLSVAHACAVHGHQVTLIDEGPQDRSGCSFGNAGMVVPSHFTPLAAPGMVALGLKWMLDPLSPFYIKPRLDWDLIAWGYHFWRAATARKVTAAQPVLRDFSLLSRECFEQLASTIPDFGLAKRGLLMLCATPHGLDEEAAAAERARELGVPADVLTPREAAERDPAITMAIEGAVHYPLDCHLVPERFVAALESRLPEVGATLRWNTRLTGWKAHNGRITAVETGDGTVEADEVVLCTGAWSTRAAAMLGLNLPMQAGKGYSVTLRNPRQLPALCSILTEARVAVTPMDGALRFGGTMEIAGLNTRINPARVRGIVRSIPRYYPEFQESDFADLQPWCGLRPCSPDGLPFVGRTDRCPNLLLATGHAMMGVSLAPATGQLIAELIEGRKPSIPLDLLSPDRYSRRG